MRYAQFFEMLQSGANVLPFGKMRAGLNKADKFSFLVDSGMWRNREIANMNFINGDITEMEMPEADVFILSDVLHYLPEKLQYGVLEKCLGRVSPGGMVIMRDADAGLRKRTLITRFTEFQSTRIFGFNRATHRLSYLPASDIEAFVRGKGFEARRHDHAKFTSNITYIFTEKDE